MRNHAECAFARVYNRLLGVVTTDNGLLLLALARSRAARSLDSAANEGGLSATET